MKMILTMKVIVITMIIITIIIKCRGIYRMPTTTNSGALFDCEVSIYASEMAYSLFNVMNRGRPCHFNSLLGTLCHLISQE